MMKLFLLAFTFLTSVGALASGTTLKQSDQIQNSTGGSAISVPSAGATFLSDTNTATVTNKSLSGSSNTFTNIPASAISSGTLAVANGGTGASSFTTNGMIYGNNTSALGVTAAGTQYQVFQAGSSGVPTIDAVHLDQSAATTGVLPFAKGGTGQSSYTDGQLLIGNTSSGGLSKSTLTAGTNISITNGNGSITISASGSSPSLNGGSGSAQSVTAGGGVVLTSISTSNYAWVVGSGGAVTVTATPSITACTADAQKLTVIGTSNTNTVHLQDQSNLASSGLSLNGDVTLGKDAVVEMHCDITQGLWVEDNRRQ